MDHMFMRDKVAVVTGSGRGIGEAIARRLAEFGAKVVITDINMETAQRVVDDIIAQGGQAKCVLFNVADFDHIKEKVEEIKGLFGRIDVWVNNAGITGSTPIEEISLESWDKMMNIDLKAMFFCTQAVFAIMKEQNYGKLVHMSSLAALRGGRSSDASYAAAKAGTQKDPKTYIPLGRYGTAEDIANAVLFYASDLSSYVTGDAMNINGGLYM